MATAIACSWTPRAAPPRTNSEDPVRLQSKDLLMNNIVYIIGAIVIIVALLSFLGLR